MDKEPGIRHFTDYQVVPETDVLEQEHIFPVHFGDAEGLAPGEAVPFWKEEGQMLLTPFPAVQIAVFRTEGKQNELIGAILYSLEEPGDVLHL